MIYLLMKLIQFKMLAVNFFQAGLKVSFWRGASDWRWYFDANFKPLPEFGYLNVTEENLTKVEFKTILHDQRWTWAEANSFQALINLTSFSFFSSRFWTLEDFGWDDELNVDWICCNKILFLRKIIWADDFNEQHVRVHQMKESLTSSLKFL